MNIRRDVWARRGLSRLRKAAWGRRFLLSGSEFEAAFQRERSLASRRARPFSLIVLVLSRRSRGELELLGRTLKPSLRCSDLLGRLDGRTLAVLLPATRGDYAGLAADRIQALLAREHFAVDVEVFSYAGDQAGDPGEDGDRDDPGLSTPDAPAERKRSEAAHARNGHSPAASNGHATPGPSCNGHPERVANGEPVRLALESTNSRVRPIRELSEIVGALGGRDVEDLWLRTCVPPTRIRRAVDFVVAATLLALASPLLAVVALLVKLTSPGPIFFVQQRAGLGGRPFPFVKFRSMYVDAEARREGLGRKNEQSGPIFKIRDDPRMTPIGRFLRRSSIDELPQLWNVLRGDMTLIGPRPPTLNEVELYEPWQRERLALPGGLTCIWQVSGRSEVGFEDWVRMDLRYAKERSLSLDLWLIARTFKAVASRRGAY